MSALSNILEELAHISPTDTTEAADELAALEAVADAAEDMIFHADSRKGQHGALANAINRLAALRKAQE